MFVMHRLSVLRQAVNAALFVGIAAAALSAHAGRTFVSGDPGESSKDARARTSAIVASRLWLARHNVPAESVQLSEAWVDKLATGHTRWQQMFKGVPVLGGEGIMHLSGAKLYALTDQFVANLSVDVTPAITSAEAEHAALTSLNCPSCTARATSTLWVGRFDGIDRLVYRVTLRIDANATTGALPDKQIVFIDAHNSSVVAQYGDLQTATGTTLYRGNVTIATSAANGTRLLEDIGRRVGTFDFRNGTTAFRLTDTDDVWNDTSQRAANDVHFASEAVMDYLRVVHGRNGIDGSGGPGVINAAAPGGGTLKFGSVHYGSAYNNAFWDGQKIVTGDGDGNVFGPLVSLDIIGHEWFHGVTQYTAHLTYNAESGALNESISDVFGAMIERNVQGENAKTWMIGEDAYTPRIPGDALRYMNNPRQGGQPDYYADRYIGSADNGGVHTNSGIANYAFYLAAKGGSHRLGGTMTGIGADAAQRIWYRALTTYLTSAADFTAARAGTTRAAQDLFGVSSAQALAVQTAWCFVGVGSCPAFEQMVNGGFEANTVPWSVSGTGTFIVASGNTPKTGAGNAYLGGSANAAGAIYQQIAIPRGSSPVLSFGLGVQSGETSTTAQNDQLFVEVRNGSGTLLTTLATFSNLNKTANGAYVVRGTYSLAPYAGQTVRVQFRAANNATLPTTFRLDDVSVK